MQYGIKGRHSDDTCYHQLSSWCRYRSQQELRYQYVKGAATNSVGYLGYCMLQVRQQLRLYDNQTIFRSAASVQNAVSTFEISQTNAQVMVWDISNPFEPGIQASTISGSTTLFSTQTDQLKTFIAFRQDAPTPKLIGKITNQNLRSTSTPDLVIVTHPDFKVEASRLQTHRQNVSNLDVVLVTTTEVYNEFSGGKQDVTAIRDFVKLLYDKNPSKLKSLLLLGKGTYDYKDILIDNKNFVPTYQSVNSLHPLLTYSSDDYFGFLEGHEGEWLENPVQQHTLEIGVGRIPAKSVAEVRNVVDKIIYYDTDLKLFNRWRKSIVFVVMMAIPTSITIKPISWLGTSI